jgi:hypothetical protein
MTEEIISLSRLFVSLWTCNQRAVAEAAQFNHEILI